MQRGHVGRFFRNEGSKCGNVATDPSKAPVNSHVSVYMLLVVQAEKKEEEFRGSREEMPLGNVPSRGEWSIQTEKVL